MAFVGGLLDLLAAALQTVLKGVCIAMLHRIQILWRLSRLPQVFYLWAIVSTFFRLLFLSVFDRFLGLSAALFVSLAVFPSSFSSFSSLAILLSHHATDKVSWV